MIYDRPVVYEECPSRPYHHRCLCGPCAECGFPLHMAIHGPYLGKPEKVWGHYAVGPFREPLPLTHRPINFDGCRK